LNNFWLLQSIDKKNKFLIKKSIFNWFILSYLYKISNKIYFTSLNINFLKYNFLKNKIYISEQSDIDIFMKKEELFNYDIKYLYNNKINFSKFKNYIKLSSFSSYINIKSNPSFSSKYFFIKNGNIGFYSIKKFFNIWNKFYIFVFNLFFYKLDFLLFSNPIFKNEFMSLNYLNNKNIFFKNFWRYLNNILFSINISSTEKRIIIFKFLKYLNINTCIFTDTNYYKDVLNITNYLGFYTIGLVPLNNNNFKVDLNLPLSNNTIISQLFFIKLVYNIDREVKYNFFTFKKKLIL